MGESIDLTVRVHVVEDKLDQLTIVVRDLSASMDSRFDAVDAAFVEQRQYTEFGYAHLEARMEARFQKIDERFDGLEHRFDGLEGRFDGLERRFDGLEARFDGLEGRFDRFEGRFEGLEGRFDGLESRFDRLEGRFEGLEGRFDRLERKLDRFIDVQLQANALVERRLSALERRLPPE